MVKPDAVAAETAFGGRARILREARALFTAQGFAAVSMQQIADAAGVNKATLYHHFRDKEDLFLAVMEQEIARTAQGLAAVIDEGGTARETLQRIARHIIAVRQSDFGHLVSDLHAHVHEERRIALMRRSTPPWELIRRVFAAGIATGELREIDTDLAARAFFAMVSSRLQWAKIGINGPETDDAAALALVDLLMDGVAAQAP